MIVGDPIAHYIFILFYYMHAFMRAAAGGYMYVMMQHYIPSFIIYIYIYIDRTAWIDSSPLPAAPLLQMATHLPRVPINAMQVIPSVLLALA